MNARFLYSSLANFLTFLFFSKCIRDNKICNCSLILLKKNIKLELCIKAREHDNKSQGSLTSKSSDILFSLLEYTHRESWLCQSIKLYYYPFFFILYVARFGDNYLKVFLDSKKNSAKVMYCCFSNFDIAMRI